MKNTIVFELLNGIVNVNLMSSIYDGENSLWVEVLNPYELGSAYIRVNNGNNVLVTSTDFLYEINNSTWIGSGEFPVYVTDGRDTNLTIYITKAKTQAGNVSLERIDDTHYKLKLPPASDIVNLVYPVGSIYMSVNNVNPSNLFGGTWEAWGTGRVPVGVNTADTAFNTVEKTGGEKTTTYTPAGSNTAVTLTAAQSGVPAHAHSVNNNYVRTDARSAGVTNSETFVFGSSSNRHGYCLTAFPSGNNKGQTYLNVPAHNTNYNTAQNATASHNHTFTGTKASISTVQPYITCYMWKRIE